MAPKQSLQLWFLFGSTGFVGKKILESGSNLEIIPISRDTNGWIWPESLEINYSHDIGIIIAAGSARFAQTKDQNYDLEIVKSINEFLEVKKIRHRKTILISSLAACNENPKNTYGLSKRNAERYAIEHFTNCLVIRPPALFGKGMNIDSHINWFIKHRLIFRVISLFSPAGMSLLAIDDFASWLNEILIAQSKDLAAAQILNIESSDLEIDVIYPPSCYFTFRELFGILNKEGYEISKIVREKKSPLFFLVPFKIKPFFGPIWSDFSHRDDSQKQRVAKLLNFQEKRLMGKPGGNSVVIVFGASGGLGSSICKTLNSKEIPFVAVDKAENSEIKVLEYCQDTLIIDLTDSNQVKKLFETLGNIGEISWLITAAGIGVKMPLQDVKSDFREEFWSLMVLFRLEVVSFAHKKVQNQERIGVVNISSTTSIYPFKEYPDYSAANTAVRIIGRLARIEPTRVTVHTVIPTGMKTRLMSKYGDLERYHRKAMSPDVVAKRIYKSLYIKKGREIYVGTTTHMMTILSKLPGQFILFRIVQWIARRER